MDRGNCRGASLVWRVALTEGLDAFVGKVAPELQRRSLFRTEYEGIPLREHLGLPRPENRFFPTT